MVDTDLTGKMCCKKSRRERELVDCSVCLKDVVG